MKQLFVNNNYPTKNEQTTNNNDLLEKDGGTENSIYKD